jgi:hypothetical protein
MNMRPVGRGLVRVVAALVLAVLSATSSARACVVGTGSSVSCTEAALNACLPGGGSFDGTVTFACGGAATITVTSTKIISADTTIDGGSVITISGGNAVGVFSVNAFVMLTVQNVTVADGFASSLGGGAIFNNGTVAVTNGTFSGNRSGSSGNGGAILNNNGTLTVTNSTFSGNSATGGGAILNNNNGTLTVTNSTFSGNSATGGVFYSAGGAIFNNNGGMATVSNSIFSGNSATIGGVIFDTNSAVVVVTNSTFSGNSTSDRGGVIFNDSTVNVTNSTFSGNSAGRGGAIFNELGTVTNSTFSGNSASGGVFYSGGGAIYNLDTVTVTSSTFSGNSASRLGLGGVIFNRVGGAATMTNSVVANSTSGGNCSITAGPVTDGGHNIDDGTTCGFAGTGCATTTGTSFCNTNPLLDPAGLANNGGPTETIALEAGSPAINAGDAAVCAAPPVNNTDQRGFRRPGAGATTCSIGAYEFNGRRGCA